MSDHPNLLLILTDQQSATMMSCAGNAFLHTPAMDSLAATGTRFDRAYCTNPVCVPSRFSLLTGRMPSEIGLRSCNHDSIQNIPQSILDGGLGWAIRRAGYEVAYGGKVHLPGIPLRDIGFDSICTDERDGLADACAHFVRKSRDRPFFLVASFINPHDICYMAIRDSAASERERSLIDRGQAEMETLDAALRRPPEVSDETFFREYCPPLPANHEPQNDEPEAIRLHQEKRHFKKLARDHYGEKAWRLHRWAYCRLTERVDAQIGRILEALRASGQEENTVVIFTSDHGDHDSSHRMEHKTVFYEEACRVPLIISRPGVTAKGVSAPLVSNGLDLLPTLCDFAGVDAPTDSAGWSLRAQVEGRQPAFKRTFLPVESELGRMIVTDRFKYMLYDEGAHREQLIDLKNDPGETRNAIADPELHDSLTECRATFAAHFKRDPGVVAAAAERMKIEP